MIAYDDVRHPAPMISPVTTVRALEDAVIEAEEAAERERARNMLIAAVLAHPDMTAVEKSVLLFYLRGYTTRQIGALRETSGQAAQARLRGAWDKLRAVVPALPAYDDLGLHELHAGRKKVAP